MTMAGCTAGTAPSPLAIWVNEMACLTQAKNLIWCDGSEEERRRLTAQAVAAGVLTPLNQRKRPDCYLHRSHPSDVSRSEELTYVCTPSRDEAGPTNNWMDPGETQRRLRDWLVGAYRGRTMYAVPYLLGPAGSHLAKPGVQLTDSLYVVLSLRIMTRMGSRAADLLRTTDDFQRGMHCTLECDPSRRLICHFPQDNMVWSVGSNYGGNALLSKKCFGLRIASYLGRKEGWLAEHMLIVGLESPQGEITYIAAAFPSACGKTNLAMLTPPSAFEGWRVFTVGDDIAWMRVGADGRLWAVNPEAGYFGVAPGTSARSNPNATEMIRSNTIFTNVALTRDGDVWWEGMETDPAAGLFDWQGRLWDEKSGQPAAHPNSRFTCPMTNNPAYTHHADAPEGVPISAIIFGGRRATTIPLVLESFDWAHGVYLGATMGSETTAAATGKVGVVRRDPMAMLPFCGYNVADYISHWLGMRCKLRRPPKIFMVNWFRKDRDGSFLWPGYGENMRILRWIVERIQGRVEAEQTAVGLVPRKRDLDLTGLDVTAARLDQALAIKREEWAVELRSQEEFFDGLDADLPRELEVQRATLAASLDL
jgi:phosphoenolpyruvate carboxykinase (GTP)